MPSLVQVTSNTSTGTSVTLTFTNNIGAGNTIVFVGGAGISAVAAGSGPDSFTLVTEPGGGNNVYYVSGSAGGYKTINVTGSANVGLVCFAYEIPGKYTLDQINASNAATASPSNSGNITTTKPYEFIIGFAELGYTSVGGTVTGTSNGWTAANQSAGTGSGSTEIVTVVTGYQFVTSIQSGISYTSTASTTTNLGIDNAIIVSFSTASPTTPVQTKQPGRSWKHRFKPRRTFRPSNPQVSTNSALSLDMAFSGAAFQGVPFPATPLGIKVEILLNGTWTDISSYVYQRNPIEISNRGKPNEASTTSTSSMTLTLNNRNGNFTPKNTSSLFYPYITRNTQIRLSVSDVAVAGGFYSGYRFYGEVSSWPVKWDVTGSDVWVEITCSGILRRINQGGAKLGSATYRYYTRLSGNNVPIAYWPCEDSTSATQFAEFEPSPAIAGTWTGTPNLSSDTSFKGSDAIPGLNGSVWTLSTGVSGNPISTGTQTYSTPGTYTWTVPAGVTAITSVSAIGGGSGGNTDTLNGIDGTAGGNSSLTGSGVTTVLAHGASSTGGTGSTNTTHHNGANGVTNSIDLSGAGGEYAAEATLTVTPGQVLTIVVGSGGSGSAANNNINVLGSTVACAGSGGGSAGGVASAGHAGTAGTNVSSGTVTGGAGGTAVSPGAAGGQGGNATVGGNAGAGSAGSSPGGGGGSGGSVGFGLNSKTKLASSGNGGAGQVQFSYNGGSTPAVPANIWRFLLHVPSGGTTDGAVVASMFTLGTIFQAQVIYHTGGFLQLKGLNSGAATLFTSTSTNFGANGTPMLVEVALTPNGTAMNWSLQAYAPGASSPLASVSGTQAAASIGEVTSIVVNPNGTLTDATSVGQVTVQHYSDTMTTVASAVNGYASERAGDRFTRLCTEESIPYVLKGNASDTPQMGPQPDDTLVNVLQEIENLDLGLLYETRDQFGLGYRTRVNLQNQTAVLTLDYSLAELAGTLEPTYDDQLTRNYVTVSRTNGSSATSISSSGTMSTQAPPNGVGIYQYSTSVNAYLDSQLANEAAWIVTLGTVDEDRYPTITVDLSRPEVATLFGTVPSVDVGDFIVISNPPAFLPSGNINQLAYGFTERLNTFSWVITINAVPESPYTGAGLPTW